jgi:hypothetical protein
MTLRPAADADAPEVPRVAMDQRGFGRPPITVTVAGAAVARLTDRARRRLVGVIATRPRTRVVARGGDASGGLAMFVALAAPPARRVEAGGMWSTGIVDATGGGIAFLSERTRPGSQEAPAFSVIAFGTSGAERELLALVDAWRAHGRPTWKQLNIGVAFRKERPRAWRTSTRGESVLSFDWSASTAQ